MTWKMRALGEVARILGGSTPRRGHAEYWNGEIPWVTPTDLPPIGHSLVVVSQTSERITQVGLDSSSAQLLPPGTVLFSSRASIGKVAIAGVPLATNQGFANFVAGEELNNRFLAYALQRYTSEITDLAGSTTFKEVSKGALKKFEVPVPPVAEQVRIVAILDQLNSLRMEAAALLAQLDGLAPDLLEAAFSERLSGAWYREMASALRELVAA